LLVEWHQPSGASGFHRLWAFAVPWLLWGLGGAIPVVGAFIAGWTCPERFQGWHAGVRNVRPLVDLLPLTAGEVRRAKLEGRVAALLVYLAAGFAVLVVAEAAMAATGTVASMPSLLDPWLVAAALIFCALFILSSRIAAYARRTGEQQALVEVVLGSFVCACLVGSVAYYLGAFDSVARVLTAFAAAAAIGAAIAPALRLLPPWRWLMALGARQSLGPADRDAPRTPPTKGGMLLGLEGLFSLAVHGLGGDKGWTTRRRTAVLHFGVLILAAGFGVSWLWQTVAFLWHAGSVWLAGGAFAEGLRGLDPDIHQVASGLAIGVAGLAMPALGFAAWPELVRIPAAWSRPQRRGIVLLEARHAGLLLPVRPDRLWCRRLGSFLLLSLVAATASVAAWLLSWLYTLLLRGLTFPPPAPAQLLAPVGLWVVGLGVFAWLPLIRGAVRALPLTGCMLTALLYAGFFGAVLTTVPARVALASRHAAGGSRWLATALLAALGVWLVGLLMVSVAWWPMVTWHPADGGGISVTSKLKAAAVWLAAPVTLGLLFAALVAMLPILD
jgi:hypothetical protein